MSETGGCKASGSEGKKVMLCYVIFFCRGGGGEEEGEEEGGGELLENRIDFVCRFLFFSFGGQVWFRLRSG